MNAAWWWIDRWRKSTAYTDMTLAQQGAYRNLLDELWLRGGVLPADDRILGKIAGDSAEWPSVRDVVLARFERTERGYSHPTHDEVAGYSARQADKGRTRAAGAQRDGGRFTPAAHQPEYQPNHQPEAPAENQPPSPSPSPSPSLISVSVSASVSEKEEELSLTSFAQSDNGNGLRARFETFWKAYPKKVGKDKAWQSWQKRHPTIALTTVMLSAVETQSKSVQWTKEGGQFIPNPTTWLNQGRWQDETTTVAPVAVSERGRRNIASAERAIEHIQRQRSS